MAEKIKKSTTVYLKKISLNRNDITLLCRALENKDNFYIVCDDYKYTEIDDFFENAPTKPQSIKISTTPIDVFLSRKAAWVSTWSNDEHDCLIAQGITSRLNNNKHWYNALLSGKFLAFGSAISTTWISTIAFKDNNNFIIASAIATAVGGLIVLFNIIGDRIIPNAHISLEKIGELKPSIFQRHAADLAKGVLAAIAGAVAAKLLS